MEAATVKYALIEYARIRDAMYQAVRAGDDKALDAAVARCRKVTEYLWDLGHELERGEIAPGTLVEEDPPEIIPIRLKEAP